MEEAKENLIELNQESIIIIMQLSEVFEKVQRNFELINSTMDVNALVSGKPRTPIPGECGSLAGDFSGF